MCVLTQLCPTLCDSVTRFFCAWDFPGKNIRIGCHFLFQRIFLSQGLNPCLLDLLHQQADSLPGKPKILCRHLLNLIREISMIDLVSPPSYTQSFPYSSVSKESACNAGDPGSIPGLGKSHGEGTSNTLQYSCLENPMNRGAWQATVHGVARVGQDLTTKHHHPQMQIIKSETRKLPSVGQIQPEFYFSK